MHILNLSVLAFVASAMAAPTTPPAGALERRTVISSSCISKCQQRMALKGIKVHETWKACLKECRGGGSKGDMEHVTPAPPEPAKNLQGTIKKGKGKGANAIPPVFTPEERRRYDDLRRPSEDEKTAFQMPSWLKVPAAAAVGGGLVLPTLPQATNALRGMGSLLAPMSRLVSTGPSMRW